MAVPKKKVSVSRKKVRLKTKRYLLQNYKQCNSCLNFVPLHRRCSDDSNCNYSTNLENKYNLDFL